MPKSDRWRMVPAARKSGLTVTAGGIADTQSNSRCGFPSRLSPVVRSSSKAASVGEVSRFMNLGSPRRTSCLIPRQLVRCVYAILPWASRLPRNISQDLLPKRATNWRWQGQVDVSQGGVNTHPMPASCNSLFDGTEEPLALPTVTLTAQPDIAQ